MSNDQNEKKYWNSYYERISSDLKKSSKLVPSQFAAFVLSEFSEKKRFIDVGCGNGRDSFFFADHGKDVIGIDGSSVAVETCSREAEEKKYNNLQFKNVNLLDKAECIAVANQLHEGWGDAIIYARFFLHAITDEAEDNFLGFCKQIMGQNCRMCVEFRTNKDELLIKETAAHYRRFIDPIALIEKLDALDMSVSYFAEGFGFAKYKEDNAYVARMIVENT